MKKAYLNPEETVIVLKTNYSLLTISGDSLGNEQKDGDDYARGGFFDEDE